MTLENPPFSIGNISSNGGFSIVMLIFGGCISQQYLNLSWKCAMAMANSSDPKKNDEEQKAAHHFS